MQRKPPLRSLGPPRGGPLRHRMEPRGGRHGPPLGPTEGPRGRRSPALRSPLPEGSKVNLRERLVRHPPRGLPLIDKAGPAAGGFPCYRAGASSAGHGERLALTLMDACSTSRGLGLAEPSTANRACLQSGQKTGSTACAGSEFAARARSACLTGRSLS